MTLLTKVLLTVLSIWCVTIVFLGLFDLQVYFPFNMASVKEIPYHRWQSVRFAGLSTIMYFMICHVVGRSSVAPLVVVDIFVKCLVFFSSILMWKENVNEGEWWVLVFYLFLAICIHREVRKDRNKIFTKY